MLGDRSKVFFLLLSFCILPILSLHSKPIQPLLANQKDTNENAKCFQIERIDLKFTGLPQKSKKEFSYAHKIISNFKPISKHCLSAKDISNLLSKIQSRTISKGYITTTFGLSPQSLSDHILRINAEVGTIGKIRYINEPHMLSFKKDFPLKKGDVLDLRKIEVGLNNLRNLRYIKPQIYITTDNNTSNQSILTIDAPKLSLPVFLGGSIDNGGSIGQNYQASLYGSWENPLHLADKLSFYALSSLPMNKKNHSYYASVSYSIPIRRFSFSFDGSYSDSAQEILFADIFPVYQGKNINLDLGIKVSAYADDKNQVSINLDGGVRLMESYLDDIKLDVQSYNLTDISLALGYQRKINNLVFNISIGILQGLPMLKKHNEKIHTDYVYTIPNVNMYLYAPFKIWVLTFGYTSNIRTQISQDRLYASKKMSIGSRYTVRGFNHFSISGQMGVIYKNDLMVYLPSFWGITIAPNIGVDWGMVRDLIGDKQGGSLSGGGIGLNVLHKNFNAQISLNAPLYNPYKAPVQNLFFSIGMNW
ncbi:hypothetical protein BKH41_04040 [Helicobacter sp. 12S02232-10]|uniref:ShlB/FhaC/HecB family hemolysin secretion/activation protein n=1 Tax=Helicobacter sp. 12S02232-10 TaxID=1476197 RepID=UPI000BA73C87|nr:ShlB/FhaC/HecB family hemolysin secretion/activation protein [Helicobacter sp. 12S02232-10]PAF49258.1 hypothetical protein BKH41_04040 [Helicobacter sp. 12S02232-10]